MRPDLDRCLARPGRPGARVAVRRPDGRRSRRRVSMSPTSSGCVILGAVAPGSTVAPPAARSPERRAAHVRAALHDPRLDLRGRRTRSSSTARQPTRTSSCTTGRVSPSPRSRSRGRARDVAARRGLAGARARRRRSRRSRFGVAGLVFAGLPGRARRRLVVARGRRRHRVLDPRPDRGGAGGPVDVTVEATITVPPLRAMARRCLHGRPRLRSGAARDAADPEEGGARATHPRPAPSPWGRASGCIVGGSSSTSPGRSGS